MGWCQQLRILGSLAGDADEHHLSAICVVVPAGLCIDAVVSSAVIISLGGSVAILLQVGVGVADIRTGGRLAPLLNIGMNARCQQADAQSKTKRIMVRLPSCPVSPTRGY